MRLRLIQCEYDKRYYLFTKTGTKTNYLWTKDQIMIINTPNTLFINEKPFVNIKLND